MKIRSILKILRPSDAALLKYALETGLTNQFIEYRPGFFVGVNMIPETMPAFTITEIAGSYSAGTITRC